MWYPDPAAARWHHDRQVRTLYVCLGASVALHALALFGFHGIPPAAALAEPSTLTALFASAASAPAASVPPDVRRHDPEPKVQSQTAPDPIPVAASATAEPAPERAAAAEPAPSASVASVTPAASERPAVAPETVDTSLFDAYRLALINAARRYKRYPVQAIERGWEGRVEIRVVVDANGTIKNVLVKSSSRYQVLDDKALEMVRKAFKDLAEVRPAPLGREFTVDVPVIFELQTG